MADLPTGTVTFLYTDIEGSTARWEQTPAAMKAAGARHDDRYRVYELGEHGGGRAVPVGRVQADQSIRDLREDRLVRRTEQ